MKYLLCQIEKLRYAVPVGQVARIEEPDGDERFSPQPWQSYLRRNAADASSYTARILLEAQPELLPLYVEEVIDLSVDYEGAISPFPSNLVDAPVALFSGIILLNELPYIVISASGLAKARNNATG
ncbi:hypothetical protein K8R78_01325 [bacterium]|nr:hypothetical protein [bacterium]